MKKLFRVSFYLLGAGITLLFIVLISTYFYYALNLNATLSNLEKSLNINSCQAIEVSLNVFPPYPERLNQLMDIFENKYSMGLAGQLEIDGRTLNRHLAKIVSTLEITRMYSYAERRKMFIDSVYLGHGNTCSIHGFRAASTFYFQKDINELSSEQLLFLVSQIRGPSYYNPFKSPKRATKRMAYMYKFLCDRKEIKEMGCSFRGIKFLNLVEVKMK